MYIVYLAVFKKLRGYEAQFTIFTPILVTPIDDAYSNLRLSAIKLNPRLGDIVIDSKNIKDTKQWI